MNRSTLRVLVVPAVCCMTGVTGLCQTPSGNRPPAPYYEDTNNIPVSPEIHGDRTVTFRLFAPKASEVLLMGSPGILEVIRKPMPLKRDEKGVWSLTRGSACAGFLHLRVRD